MIGALGFFMFDFRIFAIYLRSTDAALGPSSSDWCWCSSRCGARSTRRRVRVSDVSAPVEARAAEWYEPWSCLGCNYTKRIVSLNVGHTRP